MGQMEVQGCKPGFDHCGSQGQLAIDDASRWCQQHNYAPTTMTVDKAGMMQQAIMVNSRKTIRGVGDAGKIVGRGLLIFHTKNIIVQNIEFSDINPEFIFGGDAIALKDCDLVWLDHLKFSRIGRQVSDLKEQH